MGGALCLPCLESDMGVRILFSQENHIGFMIFGMCISGNHRSRGTVFGYGSCRKGNIYVSWPFIKISLILRRYLGQGGLADENQ